MTDGTLRACLTCLTTLTELDLSSSIILSDDSLREVPA